MKSAKRLILSMLTLAAFIGVGWGTYSLTAPSSEAAADHTGHDHRERGEESGRHEAAGEKKTAAADGHDGHAGQDDHDDLDDQDDHLVRDAPDEHDAHDDERAEAERHPAEPQDKAGAGRKDAHAGHNHGGEGEICPEHNVPEAEDALCNADAVAILHPGEGMKVRLGSGQVAERVGIATALPLTAGEANSAWPGKTVFNRERLAKLSALAAGTVHNIKAGLGDRVRKGDVLAEIAAPEAAGLRGEVAAAESRRDFAEAVYLREKDLLEKGITSRHEYQQAEAEWRQAESSLLRTRQQARDYGVSGNGSTLAVRAPFAGTVVERTAVTGEAVAAGTPLFTLADLSTLWIEISASEEALSEMRPGMAVAATFPPLPGRTFTGKIFWVGPALDEKTRMLRALAEIDNREGVLRSGLFGEIRPVGRRVAGALAVPAAAIQSLDGVPFVFVRLADDLFELRRVATGRQSGGTVTIAEGLSDRDQVVIAQAFALKSEVLRARLGASCADH